jgi:CRP-like cAMP-binding protein
MEDDDDRERLAVERRQRRIDVQSAPWYAPNQGMFSVYDLCMQAELFGEEGVAKITKQHKLRASQYRSSSRFALKLAAVEAHRNRAPRHARHSTDADPGLANSGQATEEAPPITVSEQASKFSRDSLRVDTKAPSSMRLEAGEISPVFSPGVGTPGTRRMARRRTDAGRASLDIPYEEIQRREKNLGVLKSCKFFQELQSLDGAVNKHLAIAAKDVNLKKGQVVFKQGEEPCACYAIVKGSVAIYVQSEEDALRPRSPPMQRQVSPPMQRQVSQRSQNSQRKDGKGDAAWQPRTTYEGSATYYRDESLGQWMTTLSAGACFGEMALIREKVRIASVKCLEPCDLLVVRKDNFNAYIKAEVLRDCYERMLYFQRNIVGFADAGSSTALHPSYHFEKRICKEGHCFLTEGTVVEPCIWVIINGEVTLQRKEKVKTEEKDTLGDAKAFSSMSAVSLLGAEPFDVRVSSSQCELYVLTKKKMVEVQEFLLSPLKRQIRHEVKQRVKRLSVRSALGRDAMQSPRATGFLDWREAPITAHRTMIASRASSQPTLSPMVSPTSTSRIDPAQTSSKSFFLTQ